MLRSGQKSTNTHTNIGENPFHANIEDPFLKNVDPTYIPLFNYTMYNHIQRVNGNTLTKCGQVFEKNSEGKFDLQSIYLCAAQDALNDINEVTESCFDQVTLRRLACVLSSWFVKNHARINHKNVSELVPCYNKAIIITPAYLGNKNLKKLMQYMYWCMRYSKMENHCTVDGKFWQDYTTFDNFFDEIWGKEICFLNMTNPKFVRQEYQKLAEGCSTQYWEWFASRGPLIIIGNPALVSRTQPNEYVGEFIL